MANETRYNKLRQRIKQEFSRNRTYDLTINSGNRETLFNLGDPEAVGNDSFLAAGPFNFVSVRNFGNSPVKVYFSSDRSVSVTVPDTNQFAEVTVTEVIPKRYVSYVSVENTGSNPADIEVQVGNEIDGVELDLLEQSGLLHIAE